MTWLSFLEHMVFGTRYLFQWLSVNCVYRSARRAMVYKNSESKAWWSVNEKLDLNKINLYPHTSFVCYKLNFRDLVQTLPPIIHVP
jgi:hypothetical protein